MEDNKALWERQPHSQALIRGMFDSITPRYDLLNRCLSLGRDLFWRRALARRLTAIQYPGRFLDLATGSGDQLLAIRAEWPFARLVGLDFSPNMLALARKKINDAFSNYYPEENELELILGDVYKAPFAPQSFDSVSISFGLRNLADRPRLYKEVLKLLKPGGRFLVLELYFDSRGLFAPFRRFYLKRITPYLAAVLYPSQKNAYEYLVSSVLDFPHPLKIIDEMEEAGFKGLEYLTYTFQSTMLVWGQKPLEDR